MMVEHDRKRGGPAFSLRELRMAIARKRQAEGSVDGRPSVFALQARVDTPDAWHTDPLLDALRREHGQRQDSN
jgi:hypothetical protein